MRERSVHVLSILLTTLGGVFVAWLYWAEPKTLADVSVKARTTIETAAAKTQVVVGAYEIDRQKFDEGLRLFRQENFVAARDRFERADAERRDAETQFYIAYSFYRQGFGKVFNDDALFKQGLERVDAVFVIDKDFKSADANLKLKTPAELKAEFEEGLKVAANDFNPLKILRERK